MLFHPTIHHPLNRSTHSSAHLNLPMTLIFQHSPASLSPINTQYNTCFIIRELTSTIILLLIEHHHKHCVVGAGDGTCAGDGECLTGFSSCFGFWRGNQCFWRENLLYQFQRKNYDLSMSSLWSSVHFRGRISYTY